MISIVMPTKNAEKHLAECLQSIISQSFTDWELLVVNDNSTDTTAAILENVKKIDSRIKPFKTNGNGIIDALRIAYLNSKGDYITRMDSDDIMPIKKLEIMYNKILKKPQSLITGFVKYISDNELKGGYIYYQNWLNGLCTTNTHYQEIYKECVIPSPCWLVSRIVFEKCGAFNSNTYPEDYDLTFRFYENKTPIVPIQEELHIWRDHNNRASRTDDNYSDNSFLDIKMYYFLKLDHKPEKTLVLWGAGKRSKKIALLLQKKNISFVWACNNPNKINHTIYNVLMKDVSSTFEKGREYQTLVTVANKEQQEGIKKELSNNKNVEGFWFC